MADKANAGQAEEGSRQEHGTGYTQYRQISNRKMPSGMSFMVRNSIASKLENLPTGYSDRIVSMRFLLSNRQYNSLVHVYDLILKLDPAEKVKFYSDLFESSRSFKYWTSLSLLNSGEQEKKYVPDILVYHAKFWDLN